jgi:sialic acid synthase SpsE
MKKKEIILDFGSGNTCQNDNLIIKKMIDELCRIDTLKHKVIIKWQLFKRANNNIPLTRECFKFAFDYAKKCGYETTASVFDFESFVFLKSFKKDIPFIKIANDKSLYWLQKYIQAYSLATYISVSDNESYNVLKKQFDDGTLHKFEIFCCISKYPADGIDYQELFDKKFLKRAISDHTINFKLFDMYKPNKIEWHYKLNNSTGLDAGPFARTPDQLREVL